MITCPVCQHGHKVDDYVAVRGNGNVEEEHRPTSGDAAVCSKCFSPSIVVVMDDGAVVFRNPLNDEECERCRQASVVSLVTAIRDNMPLPLFLTEMLLEAAIRRVGGMEPSRELCDDPDCEACTSMRKAN